MATSRLPPATLTLKQFMRRQQVLLLYRRILKAIRQVPNDSDRKYLKDWAREEFKRNKSATEEDTIRMMITQGNMQLKDVLSKTELHGTGLAADVSAGTDDFPAFEEGKTSYFLEFVLLQSCLSSTQEAERQRAKLK
uniref:Uncharacterized protein n=1 Tax=Ovis aries TaxID=9940 RepID=A0AC11DJ87_SHEEP